MLLPHGSSRPGADADQGRRPRVYPGDDVCVLADQRLLTSGSDRLRGSASDRDVVGPEIRADGRLYSPAPRRGQPAEPSTQGRRGAATQGPPGTRTARRRPPHSSGPGRGSGRPHGPRGGCSGLRRPRWCHGDEVSPLDERPGQPGQRRDTAVGMSDGHRDPTGDRPGEADPTGADRPDRLTGRGAVLDAPVPGAVGPVRQAERVDDRRVDRRAVRTAARGAAGRRRAEGTAPGLRRRRGAPSGEGEHHDPDEHDDSCEHGEHHRGVRPSIQLLHPTHLHTTRATARSSPGGGSGSTGRNGPQAGSRSMLENRDRSCRTALVWIWQTRLSVTPSTSPISGSVRFS